MTTSASSVSTAYIPADATQPLSGKVSSIIYTKVDFTDGVDFTITGELSGEGLWTESNVNATKTVAPRQPTHDNLGVASLRAAAGEPVEDHYHLSNDRIKIVIASGGATKTGTFTAIIK